MKDVPQVKQLKKFMLISYAIYRTVNVLGEVQFVGHMNFLILPSLSKASHPRIKKKVIERVR